MTADELDEGVRTTINVAHHLRAALGRNPCTCEIRWRLATVFQQRHQIARRDAIARANLMIEVVTTAASTT